MYVFPTHLVAALASLDHHNLTHLGSLSSDLPNYSTSPGVGFFLPHFSTDYRAWNATTAAAQNCPQAWTSPPLMCVCVSERVGKWHESVWPMHLNKWRSHNAHFFPLPIQNFYVTMCKIATFSYPPPCKNTFHAATKRPFSVSGPKQCFLLSREREREKMTNPLNYPWAIHMLHTHPHTRTKGSHTTAPPTHSPRPLLWPAL